MVEHYTAPIKHTAVSAAGTTVAGAASGAVDGAWSGFKKTVIALAVVGGLVAAVWAGFGSGLFAVEAAKATTGAMLNMSPIVGKILTTLGYGALGTAVGAAVGSVAGYFVTGPISGIIGLFKGGDRAVKQVSEERGAAAAVQAQIDMVKAQNPTIQGTTIYAPTATNDNSVGRYSFPQQGAPMNMAVPQIQGNSVQYDGLAATQQLAAAR